MHRLLQRQLKRHLPELEAGSGALPEGWENFINAVNKAYEQADTDRFRLEHITQQNSKEVLALNSQMRAAIPDTFLRLDRQGMILDYKPGQGESAYLSSEATVGKPLSRFLPEKASKKFLDAIAKLAQDGLNEVGIFHKLTNPAEDEFFYEVRILPFLDDQVIAIVRDITERKQAEAALYKSQLKLREKTHRLSSTLADLKETQAQLVQTEKMSGLGQLVAGIAHEINNPINFVSGNIGHVQGYIEEVIDLLDLYAECYPTPTKEIKERVEEIDLDFLLEDLEKTQSSMKLGVNRIKEIVLSLRLFSRLDEAEMKEVNIHEGIESTLLILNHRFNKKENVAKVEITKAYGDLPAVECYAGQLNQVFMNVLANALDALTDMRDPAAEHPAKIEIVTERLSNNFVAIRIANNGPNIPYDIRDRLFDPFFTTKPIGSGTGLGLSISYQIICDRHGGRMRCYSLPGQNTEFCIEIPIRQAH
ncbi:MAG: ATP-binding protein [Cyanobacteria bacterium P01_D01_bin.36]